MRPLLYKRKIYLPGWPKFLLCSNERIRDRFMRIITVSGAHSGVGKTTVAEALLKKLKGWSCLKVTVRHNGGFCPTGRDCGVCDTLSSKFCIVSDENIIEEKDKDTQRFKASGAKKVLWLKAKPEGLKQGLKKAIAKFKGAKGLIIEGNSALRYIEPDLAIFLKRKNSLLKDSAWPAIKKADLVLNL